MADLPVWPQTSILRTRDVMIVWDRVVGPVGYSRCENRRCPPYATCARFGSGAAFAVSHLSNGVLRRLAEAQDRDGAQSLAEPLTKGPSFTLSSKTWPFSYRSGDAAVLAQGILLATRFEQDPARAREIANLFPRGVIFLLSARSSARDRCRPLGMCKCS
jgi:hypothetical protein